jgi:hypothetical protein
MSREDADDGDGRSLTGGGDDGGTTDRPVVLHDGELRIKQKTRYLGRRLWSKQYVVLTSDGSVIWYDPAAVERHRTKPNAPEPTSGTPPSPRKDGLESLQPGG